MRAEVELLERVPTVDEYRAMRAAVGWHDVTPDVAERALSKSLYAVCLERDGRVVGCGRLVGDGAICFYVEDVAVVPELQGLGLGRRIMDSLFAWLDENVPAGRAVYLMAAEGSVEFYERYGFSKRPEKAPGMYRRW